MKPAIIIVDMLEDFFRNGRLKNHRKKLVSSINDIIHFARAHDIPIIWTRQEFKADLSDAYLSMRKSNRGHTIEGTLGSQILKELDRNKADYEIVKKRFSAFFRTDLEELLKKLGVDTLIIAGVNTHACVRMTVIDAYQMDFEVILAIDCIDAKDEEQHNSTIKYLSKKITMAKTNKYIFSSINNDL